MPPCCQPGDETDDSDEADRSARVIHVVLGDGGEDGKIKCHGGENEENETNGIKEHTPSAKRVGARDHTRMRGETVK